MLLRLCRVFSAATALLVAGCDYTPPKPPPLRVAMITRGHGDSYFEACIRGAREAAKELGAQLYVESPVERTADAQIEAVDSLIIRRMDALIIAPHDAMAIAPALKRARDNGIHVVTFDSDADEKRSGREWFIKPASETALAKQLVALIARHAGASARIAMITGQSAAGREAILAREIRSTITTTHPTMLIVDIKPAAEDRDEVFHAAQAVIQDNPQLTGLFALNPAALIGAANAVARSTRKDNITVSGLGLPSGVREFVSSGIVRNFVLWNPVNLGYLAAHAAVATAKGDLKIGDGSITAGRLGSRSIAGSEILLGEPQEFNAGNIANFDF